MTTTATVTELGCCGRRTDLQGLAAQADMHPVTTRAGRRARAALALAIVERAAMARGDAALAVRARRGLQGLGTVASTGVAAATASLRAFRMRPGEGSTVTDVVYNQAGAGVSSTLTTILAGIRMGVGAVQALINNEAAAETARAASQGREPNYTARDAGQVLAWIQWFLGGDSFPSSVAESDLRLLNSIISFAAPLIIVALEAAKLSAITNRNLGLSNALAGLITYVGLLPGAVSRAVALLPPPAAPPPPPEEVAASAPPSVQQFLTLNPNILRNVIRNPLRPGVITALQPRCPAGTTGVPPNCIAAEKSTSPILVALPAAAVLWYLFK